MLIGNHDNRNISSLCGAKNVKLRELLRRSFIFAKKRLTMVFGFDRIVVGNPEWRSGSAVGC